MTLALQKNLKKISGTGVEACSRIKRGARYYGLYGDRSSNVTAIEVLSLVPNRRETGADDVHQSLANFA
jgi:hypothetical protein